MKEMAKRTAIAALAGVFTAGMLSGCGEKELDGTKTVATVDGAEIPMGVLSLYARENQAQTEAMYISFMGGYSYSIWDTETDDGGTYGEQAVNDCLEDIELMYILKEKAADYGVELTEEDETAISEAAASFMAANTEEAVKDLAVTEDQVKTYLELRTYKERIYDPIVADVDTEVSDEEAQQSSFTYLSISTSDLSDDEIEEKKKDAQSILDTLLADPDADFAETCTAVSEDYSALTGTIDANEQEDEDDEDSYSSYPDEVIEVLRSLDDGEVGPDVIETASSLYVVRLDQKFDEEATESQKDTIISERESTLYEETTDGWMEDADIEVDEDVLKTLTISDKHSYTIATTSTETTTEDTASDETTTDEADTDEAAEESTEETTEDTAETEAEVTEAAEE